MTSEAKSPPRTTDPFLTLESTLRAKHGVPWRTAIVGERRVEYVRGKDLAAFLAKAGPDALPRGVVSSSAPPATAAAALADALLRRRRLVRCVRQFTRPKPGMHRVAKWPRRLVQAPVQTFEPTGFYAWQHDRTASPYAAAYSALLVVAVLAVCCFPLAPHPVKLAVVYASGFLLTVMLGLIGVRAVLAAGTWAATGRTVWLFPNLLDDDKGFFAAFVPTLAVEPSPASPLVRGGAALAAFAAAFALITYGPDARTAKAGAAAAHDAILDALNLHAPGRGKLGDGKEGVAAAPAPAPAPAKAAAPPVFDDDDDDDDAGAGTERTEL